ncbi:fms-related tyrosine kinase 3 ligand-like [Lacerta agilis]|uniref:fms-related tyrosine kinase 3 ligand-like n=1 Tax=Lacerta agilis TaxID=80427 RepID=UPI00141A48CD|nr:fms-related tyrosine kinase 3 ligand-like [Lacerta agilis]
MIWRHGTPESSVVFVLLLLFLTQCESSKDCIFQYAQFETTNNTQHFLSKIEELKQYLLLNYPVDMPSNLKPDGFCQELWEVHLINKKLKHLASVSGGILEQMFFHIIDHLPFIEGCNIEDSCVRFVGTNITQFLNPVPYHIGKLADEMEKLIRLKELADYSNCTVIQCQPDSFTTPVPENFTHDRNHSSQQTQLQRSHWGPFLLLLLIPISCFLLMMTRPLRNLFQRLPRFQETPV